MTSISACAICHNEIPLILQRQSKNVFLCSYLCTDIFIDLIMGVNRNICTLETIKENTHKKYSKEESDNWHKLAKSMMTRTW